MFGHERFDAYQISIKFIAATLPIAGNVPRGYSDLKDQLTRAAISIALNIAEGTGKNHAADRMRFYSIAKGSALECAAIFDVLLIIDKTIELKEVRALLFSIVRILSAVILRGSKND